MTTFLGARSLIFDMDTGGTPLDEELCQLHDGRQTTMAGVGISNDGSQVVDIGNIVALFLGGCDALLTLFSIVEELGHEQLVDLVGNGILIDGVRLVGCSKKKSRPGYSP